MAGFDEAIFNWFFGLSHQNIVADAIIIFLAKYLLYLLIVAALFFVISKKTWQLRLAACAELALAGILARGILANLFKFFYSHPRPFELLHLSPLIAETGNSFPSGHASLLFALAIALFYLNRRWGIWFLLFALLNGLARVSAGVHWPLDIVGGIALGVLSAIFVHNLLLPYIKKIVPPQHAAQ